MKILFLSAWYPHRYDAMAGLFVQKHALAISQSEDVTVLYLHPDEHITTTEITQTRNGKLNEIIVYYPVNNTTALRKLTKAIGFCKAFLKGFKHIQRTNGLPDIVHVNVLTRCAVLAYYLHRKHHIPYVITEHWSRYLPQNFSYTGLIRKTATHLAVKHAHAIMPVCQNLANAMQQCGIRHQRYLVVPNVVDDNFYHTERQTTINNHNFTFLHVSCFDEKSKNILGTLRAIKQLTQKRNDFKVRLVGTGTEFSHAVSYAQQLNIPDNIITFTGELSPNEVCQEMSQADALLLFSNYENAPVVISEALASGLPIIASNVGGIPEMVDHDSGILIEPRNEEALTQAMQHMLTHHTTYDSQHIRSVGQRYQTTTVRKQLLQIYQQAIAQQHKQ
ncbi:MAG: glycosyltransferase [Bacteroidales bacterium]|nr:glycosyltransferase [Bacteroidales bacterium]